MERLKYLVPALVALLVAAGCGNTGAGMEKDTEQNMQATGEAVENAGEAIQEAGKDVSEAADGAMDAAKLTPMIKAAIVANPMLNDGNNEINVDTTDEAVYLKGHVSSEENKKTAEELTQKILTENKANHKIMNELEVRANH